MKKTLTIIFILICTNSFSQDFSKIKFQRYYTNASLVQNNIGLYTFLKYNKGNDKIEIKIDTTKPRKIIDSLKVIERKRFLEKAIGRWKYVDARCSGCIFKINGKNVSQKEFNNVQPEKYIEIFDETIHFLNKKGDKTQKENIKFTEEFYWASTLIEIVFADKTIREITIDESGKYLKIFKSGEETERGRTPPVSCALNVEYYIREE